MRVNDKNNNDGDDSSGTCLSSSSFVKHFAEIPVQNSGQELPQLHDFCGQLV